MARPVVVCALIMPLEGLIEGVTDSKKLTEKKRNALFDQIKEKAIACEIYQLEPEEIDKINILEAVKVCFTNAVKNLKVKPDAVLIDGNNIKLPIDAEYVVKGDLKSYTIGCASIVAKVYRDRLMEEYAKVYPDYGFEKHKGYGTKTHIDKIKEIGPCKIHRRTFIKNFWAE